MFSLLEVEVQTLANQNLIFHGKSNLKVVGLTLARQFFKEISQI